MRWQDQAKCLGMDTNLFFPDGRPEKGKRHPKAFAAEAKKVCKACPVQADCLEFALDNSVQGVWGGTVEQERVDIRRLQGIRLPHATRSGQKWLSDYHDLIDSGWTQMQIWRSKGVQMEAFLRQLRRYGIPRSTELQRWLDERKWVSA